MRIFRPYSCVTTAFLALTIPVFALPAAAGTGSVVLSGPTVDANSGYGPTSFDQIVTLADGDVYDIFGTYYANYSDSVGTSINLSPTVVYEGTAPSVANDTIEVDFNQQFFDSRPGTWDGPYTASTPVNFLGVTGAGSSVTAEIFYDGQSVGSGSATSDGVISNSSNLTGLNGDTLIAVYDIDFHLNAGTQSGAGAAISVAPEPAETLPLCLSLALVLYAVGARRRKSA